MRKQILIAGLLIIGVAAIFFASRPGKDTQPGGPGDARPAARPGESAPDAKPGEIVYPSGMKPGEVRPGNSPDTLIVQPLGPEPPKEIRNTYRAKPPEEDPRVNRTPDGQVIFTGALDLARMLHDEKKAPQDDVEILDAIVAYYRMVYRMNPVAEDNAAVIRSLTGKNPQQVVVFPADHADLDANGQLLDRWGTPYFFHALSRDTMDIWSAGPDAEFGTIDDVKLGADNPALQLEGDLE